MKRNPLVIILISFILLTFSAFSWKTSNSPVASNSSAAAKPAGAPGADLFEQYVTTLYDAAGLADAKLDFTTFKKALVGYMNLRKENLVAKSMITIVDFNLPSTQKRMWIIDLEHKKLLFNNLVAHGQGSGDDFARTFSNTNETHQSSLGFYVTSETYQGKHGLSLKLKGMDKGYNDHAESRAIVLHGAEYVSQDFIDRHGRLGRSFGCPAVPVELTPKIIDTVKGKSCIFINGPEKSYISNYLNSEMAVSSFVQSNSAIIQAKI